MTFGELVGSFLVLERRLEFRHRLLAGAELKAALFGALGVQLFQIERHRLERGAHARLDLFELRAADFG